MNDLYRLDFADGETRYVPLETLADEIKACHEWVTVRRCSVFESGLVRFFGDLARAVHPAGKG